MHTVFIAGSITIKNIDDKMKNKVINAAQAGCHIVLGDADGADSAIQQILAERDADRVTIFCTGVEARNNRGNWSVNNVVSREKPGSRAYYIEKDKAMTEVADFGLMIWDCKSTGTLGNIIRLLERSKKTLVFINKHKAFLTISGAETLEKLLSTMSPTARLKAESKLDLSKKISNLQQKKLLLEINNSTFVFRENQHNQTPLHRKAT